MSMAEGNTITFIGAGNMATALIEGLLNSKAYAADNITATDVRADALAALQQRLHINTLTDHATAIATARCVVIAVKPPHVEGVLQGIARHLRAPILVVSIAAGVRIQSLAAALPPATPIIRAMPNTPAMVRAGATAFACSASVSEADIGLARALFESVGICVQVDEPDLDAVTALSGSGPAYVFRFIEALIEGAVAIGLQADIAAALALQTVRGAADLLQASGKLPQVLRAEVSSPGGTTLAGLEALQLHGFEKAVHAALVAAQQRSKELGKP